MLKKIKKDTVRIFKELGFKITIETGLTKCNFLHVTMNISKNDYKLYRKENINIKYIERYSNHPNVIKKNLPKMIQK